MIAAPAGEDVPNLRALESLLAFWADAGVETLYGDAPRDRTAPVAPSPVVETRSARSGSADGTPEPSGGIESAETDSMGIAHARELATAAHDLDALATSAALTAGAGWSGYAFYRGDPAGEVVVIVDPPDADDRREGRPATGAKGRLLDRMLAAAALDGRTLVLNATLRRGADGHGAADPALFKPFIERALSLVRPRAVIATGATAARLFFTSDEPIPRLRGRWTLWDDPELGSSTPVLATFSPSLLLAQPLAKKLAWRDIMTLQERLEEEAASALT